MSVFITLEIDDPQSAFKKQANGALYYNRLAGEANVRRPLRGIEIKEDSYATMRVIQADGNEIPIFDSSDSSGMSTRYANFMLQSVQEARMEKQQIVETFGEPYIYFFGEAPRFIDCSAILVNSNDFNWRAEWWENYDKYLRGTKLVEQGARCYLFYDQIIIEGYMMQAQAVETADAPYLVQLNFRLFVTNYANISFIGDPFYPVREDSGGADNGIDLTSADAIAKLTPKARGAYPGPGDMAAEVYTSYLKQVGAVQLQQQIKGAQSLAQAQYLQKQYALQQLGLGTDILGALGGELKKTLTSLFAEGNPTKAFGQLGQDIAKQVKSTGASALADLKKQFGKNFEQFQNPNGFGGEFNLADVLRRSLFYSTPYPGQNIDAFLRNASFDIFQAPTPPPELQRTFPLRSKITDNYDEYTKLESGQEKGIFQDRLGTIDGPGGDAGDPNSLIDDEVCKRGAQTSAATFYAFGLVGWSPGQGFSSSSGSGSVPGVGSSMGGFGVGSSGPLGFGGGQGGAVGFGGTGNGLSTINPAYLPAGYGGYVLGFGKGFRPSFSRSPGMTPGVGGAYGGAMGGGIGPGVGGAFGGYGANQYGNPSFQQFGNPMQQQFAQNPFSSPSGDPYGLGFNKFGPNTSTAYPYTAGYAPDGSFKGGFQNGATTGTGISSGVGVGIGGTVGVGVGGTAIFGGGSNMNAVAGFGPGISGSGAFGMQAIPGSLDPTLGGGKNGNCNDQTAGKNSATP